MNGGENTNLTMACSTFTLSKILTKFCEKFSKEVPLIERCPQDLTQTKWEIEVVTGDLCRTRFEKETTSGLLIKPATLSPQRSLIAQCNGAR